MSYMNKVTKSQSFESLCILISRYALVQMKMFRHRHWWQRKVSMISKFAVSASFYVSYLMPMKMRSIEHVFVQESS